MPPFNRVSQETKQAFVRDIHYFTGLFKEVTKRLNSCTAHLCHSPGFMITGKPEAMHK